MSKKRGLPSNATMRHDAHYVETLTRRFEHHVGKYVSIDLIDPNPEQPRQDLGDLDDLKASILAKGVLEPLLVRPSGEARYQIISGERRYHAALESGLDEVPVVEIDASDAEVLEIALIENLQRKDLSPFEEADGFQALVDMHGYTQEKVAEVVGKARSSVAETLRLRRIPPEIRDLCTRAGITAKSVLIEISRLESAEDMSRLIESIVAGDIEDRHALRQAKRAAKGVESGHKRPFVFRFGAPDESFRLQIAFREADVSKDAMIRALESTLEQLRSEVRAERDEARPEEQ